MVAIADGTLRNAGLDGRSRSHSLAILHFVGLVVGLFIAAQHGFAQDGEPTPAVASEIPQADISSDELALVRAAEQARIAAIDKVYGTVVAIYGNDRAGGGSGVLVDPSGYAVTNHHVVAAAGAEGWAGLADGKLYRWKLVGTDPGGDLAVIQLRGKDAFPTASLGDSNTVRVGDWSMAMGNPFTLAEDQRPTVTLGIVSGVNRYQPGEGLNQLVYGNCIQVDSSINPGNSGGPLFNLRGEIIGINGRGSFQERGRVNVGLGYAISSNQVRLFLPELLATKIAQHGTLDAQFGTRTGGVICETLNLESPAASAGLQLGDRLVEFEDVKITTANQFTSLIATYPAGWPVKFVVERNPGTDASEQKTIHVRLMPLPYEPLVRPSESKPADQEKGQPDKDPMPPKPEDGEKPALPPKPVQVRIPKLPLAEAGKIRDLEQNRVIASMLLERWREQRKEKPQPAAVRFTANGSKDDKPVESHVLTIVGDGRCRSEWSRGDQTTIVACDGQIYWQQLSDKQPEEITPAKATRNPQFSAGLAIASLRAGKAPQGFGRWQLDGADCSQNQLCYRLSTSDETGEQFFIWLSFSDPLPFPQGRGGEPVYSNPEFRCDTWRPQSLSLVKSAVGIDEDEPIPAVLYDYFVHIDSQDVWPAGLVTGLAEMPVGAGESINSDNRGWRRLEEVDDAIFKMPKISQP